MCAKRSAFSAVLMNATAVDAASPASFQPSNAHTIAGARRPAGRRSQMSGCIRSTVHHASMAAQTIGSNEEPPGTPEDPQSAGGSVPTVATLREGQEIDAVFACARKERQMSRAGTPYLTVELRDSTGSIVARAFRDADLLAGRFERGELVRVHGRVGRFRDQLQIALGTIARADGVEADPARFLPVGDRDL